MSIMSHNLYFMSHIYESYLNIQFLFCTVLWMLKSGLLWVFLLKNLKWSVMAVIGLDVSIYFRLTSGLASFPVDILNRRHSQQILGRPSICSNSFSDTGIRYGITHYIMTSSNNESLINDVIEFLFLDRRLMHQASQDSGSSIKWNSRKDSGTTRSSFVIGWVIY